MKALLKPTPARYELTLTIIRVVTGIIFFIHGWQKLFTMGIGGVEGFFASLSIPAAGFFAAVVTFVELLGGLALILGLGTRIAASLLAVDMLVAFLVFHLPNGFYVSNGGYEFVFILFAAAVGIALSGAGSLSIDSNIS